MNKKLLFIFLLFSSPFVWWNLFKPATFFSEVSQLPHYLVNQRKSIFSEKKIKYINDARWYSLTPILGRFFFNKLYLIPDEVFYGLQAISPHNFYSQSGLHNSTPKNTPAIPFILFPFTVSGLYQIIKTKRLTSIFIFFLTALIPILTGQPDLFFLFPTLIVYLYFSYFSIKNLKNPHIFLLLLLLLFYNLFIVARINLL